MALRVELEGDYLSGCRSPSVVEKAVELSPSKPQKGDQPMNGP